MFPRHNARATDKVSKASSSTRNTKETLRRRTQSLSPPTTLSPIEKYLKVAKPFAHLTDMVSTTTSVDPDDGSTTTVSTWVGSMEQGVLQLKTLLVKCKNNSLTPETKETRVNIIMAFLWFLESEVEMTPAIKEKHKLDQVLALPAKPELSQSSPPEVAELCRTLLEKFEEENWGADEATGGGEAAAEVEQPQTGARATTTIETASVVDNIRLPPANHEIWGLNGIMHGLSLKEGPRPVYVLDPRYRKKNPKVFGHNGFEPGAWWPYQRLAHFAGAHGAPIRGITGTTTEGAYSIVTSGSSGTYDDMDKDYGDLLFYSADNSHDNTDANNIAYTSNATKSLHVSLETGRPVRVLRSSGGKKAYTPKVGIRYDGLYRVVRVRLEKNNKGGLFEQFELSREPGQRPLDDINANVPSREQVRLFYKSKEGY